MYLTRTGWGKDLPGYNVAEIDPDRSVFLQLMQFPMDEPLEIITPKEAPRSEAARFYTEVGACFAALTIARETYRRSYATWMWNILENQQRILAGEHFSRLRLPGKTTAVLVGNGPSLEFHLDTFTPPPHVAVFCCLHAAHKLTRRGVGIDVLVQCDAETPKADFEWPHLPGTVPLVVNPFVLPELLARHPDNPVFVHLGRSFPLNGWFANRFGVVEDPQIVGTVAHLMGQAAMAAGIRRIVLLGVDLCHEDGASDPLFDGYRAGMAELASLHPEVMFQTTSFGGVPIPGYEITSLTEL